MHLNITWINILILFGALQGLIFTVILLFNKTHPGVKFLSVFMLVLVYNGFETLNWSAGLDKYIIFFELFSFILIFALGPSIYLYIHTLLYPETSISRKQIFAHYSIVLFQFTYRVAIAILYFLWKFYAIKVELAAPLMGIFWLYAEPLSILIFLAYMVASVRLFRKVHAANKTAVGSKERQQLIHKWVMALLACMGILSVFWPMTYLSQFFFEIPYGSQYYPIELVLVLFIYWIAFTGYHRTKIIYTQIPTVTPAEAEKCLARLRQAMETDKLYLDPVLSLKKVSNHTSISAKTISATLNQHYHRSFNDFINDYRVREVKDKLANIKNQHLTISGIALESGFNSQATFQRAFKSITGLAPREYLDTQPRKNEKTLHYNS